MSSTTPTSASPEEILLALRSHLLPHPVLSHLPTTLNLLAHIQLLSLQISIECVRALTSHARLVKKLRREGYSDREQVVRGVLSEREGYDISEIQKLREEANHRMLAFSLEFRKHHIATLLALPKLPPGQINGLVNAYFPSDLTISDMTSHPALYIRCMSPNQISLLDHYGKIVRGWYKRKEDSYRGRQPPLSYSDFYPDDQDNGKAKQDSLCKNLLKEAEKVLEDIATLEEIFAPNAQEILGDDTSVKEEVELLKPVQAEREKGKEVDYREKMYSQVAVASPGRPKIPISEKLISSIKPSVLPKPTQPGNFNHVPPSTSTPSNLSKLPPHSSNLMKSKSSSSLKDSRRVTISSGQASQVPRSETIELGAGSSNPSQSAISIPPWASQATASINRRQTLSSVVQYTSTPSSLRKKRPRQSFPSTGPEYTTPLKHDTVRREKLRPFENSELHRGKRARMEGGSMD
ncbi:uncharacterized protein IL334_002601 [Kwoniella shivajii]|uniref:DNA replication regulator Sld3 C-terminal domain-containing protein n=1 Tax=Kwoniella shivajii TaxID=564305 RepID=A0ABZ1CVJ8_9TREE|nr:hypothetical protein IL334_002601 [Kwoniella shivajii]